MGEGSADRLADFKTPILGQESDLGGRERVVFGQL